MSKYFTITLLYFLLCGCTKNSTSTNNILHDNSPKTVAINPYNNSTTFSAYDIFGDGKTYLSLYQSKYFYLNLNYLYSTCGNGAQGSGGLKYNDQNFNIDTNYSVEIYDTVIANSLCASAITLAKFYDLNSYGQNLFPLTQFKEKNFLYDAPLSSYRVNSSCNPYAYYYNYFIGSGYIVFRVRNKRNNKSKYGWAKITASTSETLATFPILEEIAVNNNEDSPLAPGKH